MQQTELKQESRELVRPLHSKLPTPKSIVRCRSRIAKIVILIVALTAIEASGSEVSESTFIASVSKSVSKLSLKGLSAERKESWSQWRSAFNEEFSSRKVTVAGKVRDMHLKNDVILITLQSRPVFRLPKGGTLTRESVIALDQNAIDASKVRAGDTVHLVCEVRFIEAFWPPQNTRYLYGFMLHTSYNSEPYSHVGYFLIQSISGKIGRQEFQAAAKD